MPLKRFYRRHIAADGKAMRSRTNGERRAAVAILCMICVGGLPGMLLLPAVIKNRAGHYRAE